MAKLIDIHNSDILKIQQKLMQFACNIASLSHKSLPDYQHLKELLNECIDLSDDLSVKTENSFEIDSSSDSKILKSLEKAKSGSNKAMDKYKTLFNINY
jgi:hypothetical protein